MTMKDNRYEVEREKWKKEGGPRPHLRFDGIPTRCDRFWKTPAELAIDDAMEAVERHSGGSLKLTEAVTLLSNARDCVADHVEGETK